MDHSSEAEEISMTMAHLNHKLVLDHAQAPVAPNLEQIMRQAEQTPFATDVLQATKQESAETPCFFDLAKHRFHDHLASAVQRLVR